MFSYVCCRMDSLALTPEETEALRIVVAVLSTVSFSTCFLVLITYSLFEEKRRTSTSQLIFFQIFVGFMFDLIFALSGFAPVEKFVNPDESLTFLCYFQASGILLFGNLLLWIWLAITLNLFLLVVADRGEAKVFWYIIPAVMTSCVLTLIPLLTGTIKHDTVWCFIGIYSLSPLLRLTLFLLTFNF